MIHRHRQGTKFNIGVDPKDGLLHAGAPGYQLTWMDAKVDDWVVTPRRGKPVEIQALWYNALCLMGEWANRLGDGGLTGGRWPSRPKPPSTSGTGTTRGYLYDVVDGEEGDDRVFGRIRFLRCPCAFPSFGLSDGVRSSMLSPKNS